MSAFAVFDFDLRNSIRHHQSNSAFLMKISFDCASFVFSSSCCALVVRLCFCQSRASFLPFRLLTATIPGAVVQVVPFLSSRRAMLYHDPYRGRGDKLPEAQERPCLQHSLHLGVQVRGQSHLRCHQPACTRLWCPVVVAGCWPCCF